MKTVNVEFDEVVELQVGDEIVVGGEIRGDDLVRFERIGPTTIRMSPVRSQEAVPHGGALYSVERNAATGAIRFVHVRSTDESDMAEFLQSALLKLPDWSGWVCRDTELPAEVLALYEPGRVVREPAFLSASRRIAGFARPHRFLIMSRHGKCLDFLSEYPEEEEVVHAPGTLFEVIDHVSQDRVVQIALLEVDAPGEAARAAEAATLVAAARESLQAVLQERVQRAHRAPMWLAKVADPVGVSPDGVPYPIA